MKNVQIIDGARNCAYEIYSFTDEEFSLIFPDSGQDVEFIEDAIERSGDRVVADTMRNVWLRRVEKTLVQGIHGTLFYELIDKKVFYPTKKEAEMVTGIYEQ